mmetsp:Transcript_88825/g.148192  ORF Transcript_88825/g.148192 Transcript_88825/m.148192 type:complete len:97 (+) Transcript_88825:304-594(+)
MVLRWSSKFRQPAPAQLANAASQPHQVQDDGDHAWHSCLEVECWLDEKRHGMERSCASPHHKTTRQSPGELLLRTSRVWWHNFVALVMWMMGVKGV